MKDEPAYPSSNDVTCGNTITGGHAGLTKREYFSAMALGTLTINYPKRDQVEFVAELSIAYADALIKELEK
jgi:hypothetical protein